MPKEISTQVLDPLQKPAPMTPTMRSGVLELLSRLRPEGERRYAISDVQAPTASQRQALQARSSTLDAAIRARGSDVIRAKLAVLVGILPSPLTDTGDADAAVSVYQAVLSDLPPWAVDEACMLALRGKVGTTNGKYRPTPGEMHAAAENLVYLLAIEKRDIDRILTAQIEKPRLSAEERKAVIAKVGRLTADCVEACTAFPKKKPAPDHRDMPAEKEAEGCAATARLHEMAREVGNEWRG